MQKIKDTLWNDRKMRRALLMMVAASGGVAIVRYIGWIFLIGLRVPPGFFGMPHTCVFVAVIFTGIPILLFLMLWTIWQTRNLLPAAVLGLGILLAFLVPLPVFLPTPEGADFKAHRGDYEAVLELARQNKLRHWLPDCPAGYKPPDAYRNVSAASCMFVTTNESRGFSVRFYPFERFHYVLYVEKITEYPCMDDGEDEKIDGHWRVCTESWN